MANSRLLQSLVVAAAATVATTTGAFAGGYCADLRLNCENGRTYPICPIAVSDAGELVTARLALGGGRGVHVRLAPMGVGYRYFGNGVWFDGLRGDATLFLGKDHPIACIVERD